MFIENRYKLLGVIILFAASLAGCISAHNEVNASLTPTIVEVPPISPPSTLRPTATAGQRASAPDLSRYAFPKMIDASKQYLFYLHGRIIEDQGIPAISPEFGEYEYGAILEKLGSYGFVVISEQRSKDTDSLTYARRVADQVTTLLADGVPAKNITVVGASKGAAIAVLVSNLLENEKLNFAILAICHPDEVSGFIQSRVFLAGNVLSLYDAADEYAGSCQSLFFFSKGKGLARYDEIVLEVGTGHGILYQPLDEWIVPVVNWARQKE